MYLCLDNDEARAEILNSVLEKISTWAQVESYFKNTKTELKNVSRKKGASAPTPKILKYTAYSSRTT